MRRTSPVLLAILFAALPFSLRAQDARETIKALVESYGISGSEEPVRKAIQARLPRWARPEVDGEGNLLVEAGRGGPHLVFIAHMDEIGYRVAAIEQNGEARLEKLGGFFDHLFEGQIVLVHTRKGPVRGIIAPRPDYRSAERKHVRAEELRLYLGVDSAGEAEELGVAVGDTVTVPKRLVELGGDRLNARSFDDRVGCAALVLAANRIDPARLSRRVSFVWSVREEVGLEGAKAVAARLSPDYVFAVDTFVSSDSPREPKRFAYARVGQGAVVRAIDNSNIVPRRLVQRVIGIAGRRNIPIQYGVTGGGNDGAVFVPRGAYDIPIGWPLRYSHSPAEVIARSDLEALAALVQALAEEF